jgi:hypothetical protein
MEITGFITVQIIGTVIGVLGRLVVPGRQRLGVWLTIIITGQLPRGLPVAAAPLRASAADTTSNTKRWRRAEVG